MANTSHAPPPPEPVICSPLALAANEPMRLITRYLNLDERAEDYGVVCDNVEALQAHLEQL